ncbi:hypothetical protein [Pseudofulvibacter geojedonensis]|uniref:Uncharacterized protein n=1 Tax=Pseudofulvibacter geojedonensis TaxID=1123758 RepID=A0ABW3I5H9_9FLAO
MKNLRKFLAVLTVAFLVVSCDQDESIPNIPRDNSTNATIQEDNVTVSEGGSPSITVVQEGLVEEKFDALELGTFVSGQIGIRVIGGTAVQGEDFDFTIPTVPQVSYFLQQGGYYYGYDASVNLQNTLSNFISITNDGVTEGPETIELALFPVGIGAVVINDTVTITIND